MALQKILIVLKREYLYNFRRPSFLFTAFGVPALTLVALFLIFQFTSGRESDIESFQRVAYLDRAGVVTEELSGYERYFPLDGAENPADWEALEAEAQAQIDEGTLDAYFVIHEDYVFTGQVDVYANRNISEALLNDIRSFLRAQIVANAPVDLPVPVERLSEPADIIIRDLESDEELGETGLVGRILLPFIFAFLYFMATSTTAQFLMTGVVEEKENRLMEILATSLRPLELLWGKLLGLGALALTQIVLWLLAGILLALQFDEAREFISGAQLDGGLMALLGVVFVLNFALFSAIMLGIGAAVTAEAESRQYAGIFTFITVIPIALISVFFTNPDGPLPLFFTFFPLTAGMGLILRIGLTDLPTWQIALSLVVQAVTTVALVWLAAKVFRLGMLMYGKPLTPRTLWAALKEGRTTLTTATVETDAVTVDRPARKQRSLFRR